MTWFEIYPGSYWIFTADLGMPAVGEVQAMIPGYVARLAPVEGVRRHVFVPPLGTFPTLGEARAAVEQAVA